MKKTLLFHITNLLGGGIEKILMELLGGLDPEKYRIKLSVAYDLGELEVRRDQLPPHVELSYILDSPVFTGPKKNKILNKRSLPEKLFEEIVLPVFKKRVHTRKIRELVMDADIIIDFDMTLASYTHLFPGKKKVAYCHFSFNHYWAGDKRKLDKHANRLRQYDKVVMLCDEMLENAIAMYPFLEKNSIRIYNALDTDRIKKLAAEPLPDLGHLADEGYFLSAGRLAETQKDFTMLIKGYAETVKKYGLKERLVIIGAGPDLAALESLAKDECVGDKIVFAGFRENPYNWMRNSKLFLFCSKFEGLPTVLIEALSLGCPIIATATPTGIEEILMRGRAGVLVKPGDVSGLSDAIFSLHSNAARQLSFRQNSQEILGQFEIAYMVKEFEKVIIG